MIGEAGAGSVPVLVLVFTGKWTMQRKKPSGLFDTPFQPRNGRNDIKKGGDMRKVLVRKRPVAIGGCYRALWTNSP